MSVLNKNYNKITLANPWSLFFVFFKLYFIILLSSLRVITLCEFDCPESGDMIIICVSAHFIVLSRFCNWQTVTTVARWREVNSLIINTHYYAWLNITYIHSAALSYVTLSSETTARSSAYQYEHLRAAAEGGWGIWFVSEAVIGCIMHPLHFFSFCGDQPGVRRHQLPTSV